jgi:RNA polymerase sigma-70 factor (ECF subfamily)
MPAAKENIIDWGKTYTKNLLAYTLSKVEQNELAEDLVQETFISAYQSYEKFEERSNVKTWLFSILKHKIADHYRTKYKKSIEVSSDIVAQFFNEDHGWKKEYRPIIWKDEKELLDDPEFEKALKNCFDRLPEKWS